MRAALAFLRLSRPLFLTGGFAGVAFGAAVAAWAGSTITAGAYAQTQALVTAFHLMVHYANDYFDRDVDRWARRTAWSGGSGILPDGELPAATALVAAIACAAIGTTFTALAFARGNLVLATIGCAIGVLAWIYSAPPLRLCARGLGELDTVAVVAVLVPFAGDAGIAGRLDAPMVGLVLAPALAMFVMMLAVEYPDAGSDAAAAKRTLVVRWGPAAARRAMLAVGAAAVLAVAGELRRLGLPGLLAAVPCGAAIALAVVLLRDPKPARVALLGIAFYALTVAALAAGYGLAASART